nr:hypothetical protein [uncultured Desulfobacter sp.]
MTSNLGSLPLARIYEKQGYIDEALEIYRTIDTSQNDHVLDAISRLEAQKETADDSQDRTKSTQMAHLLEVWVRLIVMRKRTDIFKAIRARL